MTWITASTHAVEEGGALVDVLSGLGVPMVGAIAGYALALTFADEDHKAWLAGPWITLLLILVGAIFIGQASWLVLADLLANVTDGVRGDFEAVVSIAVTAVVLPLAVGPLYRYDRGACRE